MNIVVTRICAIPRCGISLLLLTMCFSTTSSEAMDRARKEAGVDRAVQEFGVSGRGVLVAIMDRGIDWLNVDFRNSDGTTRIEYIYDLTDDRGASAPENVYKMGTIYTKSQIDRALKNGTPLATRDAVGHGTTTTGIAAGNGRGSPGRRYRGIAPNAGLIVVKITTDDVPAHDSEPAEKGFWDGARVPIAIDFIQDKARELARPCVMLLNVGSIPAGPIDGTSSFCRKIDATVGPGRPGLIFVTGPGDDGGRPNRAGGVLTEGKSVEVRFRKLDTAPLGLEIWYSGGDRFDVSINSPTSAYGPFSSPISNNDETYEASDEFKLYHKGSEKDYYDAQNGKRGIWLNFTGAPGVYVVKLHPSRLREGRFDAALGAKGEFMNHLVPGSICDGATARYNICPGCYINREAWTNVDGVPRRNPGGREGELWKWSSVGPTYDGRLGVDFCTPGDAVYTTYNPRSQWATGRHNLIIENPYMYGFAGAVSASAPLAVGIIALMLEMDPKLDALTVKQILQRTSRGDRFTGVVPNPNWGYGKVDAYAALREVRLNRDR